MLSKKRENEIGDRSFFNAPLLAYHRNRNIRLILTAHDGDFIHCEVIFFNSVLIAGFVGREIGFQIWLGRDFLLVVRAEPVARMALGVGHTLLPVVPEFPP